MAALDKFYVKYYDDLDNLRLWALIYYPKLFTWWYSYATTMTHSEFTKYVNSTADKQMKSAHEFWEKVSSDGTLNAAIACFMAPPYNMCTDDAEYNAMHAYEDRLKSISELRTSVCLPVMNTPFKIDKKLKWICPLPCVREYLKENCGVKERWYYKLFWKGKERFRW